jgi:hypothetical protein
MTVRQCCPENRGPHLMKCRRAPVRRSSPSGSNSAPALLLWIWIGIALGAVMGGFWFLEGTTSLDRRLWLQHVRNRLRIGGRIADLPNLDSSDTRVQVPKQQVWRYAWCSYQIVSRRLEESVLPGLLLAVGGTVTSAFFLRERGRSATEDRHIRGATLAPVEAVVELAKAFMLLSGCPKPGLDNVGRGARDLRLPEPRYNVGSFSTRVLQIDRTRDNPRRGS